MPSNILDAVNKSLTDQKKTSFKRSQTHSVKSQVPLSNSFRFGERPTVVRPQICANLRHSWQFVSPGSERGGQITLKLQVSLRCTNELVGLKVYSSIPHLLIYNKHRYFLVLITLKPHICMSATVKGDRTTPSFLSICS